MNLVVPGREFRNKNYKTQEWFTCCVILKTVTHRETLIHTGGLAVLKEKTTCVLYCKISAKNNEQVKAITLTEPYLILN